MGKDVHWPSMLCAGGVGSTTCAGDNGGPLVCKVKGRWVLQGFISWGKCSADQYTVTTRVSVYTDWINNIIGKLEV